jgi:hypothetical protein
MNLGDVRTRVKRQFGDESQVQINDSDITRWVNDAQRFVVMQSDGLLQKAATADLVANQQEYSVPTDLLILRSISTRLTASTPYFPLIGLSPQEFDQKIGDWDGGSVNSGTAGYYHIYGTVIKLWPIPVATLTAGLKIYYSKIPTDVAVDADTIDLPLMYHSAVVNYCLQQAYELDDSSWEAAKVKGDQVLTDIHMNKGRENRSPSAAYGRITVLPEDM